MVRPGRTDSWSQLGSPAWPRDCRARACDHRAGPSVSLGGRDDEGGVSGGRGSSVNASPGGGQDASWFAMVKSGGFWVAGGAEARTLKSVILTKPLVPLVRAQQRFLLELRVFEKDKASTVKPNNGLSGKNWSLGC